MKYHSILAAILVGTLVSGAAEAKKKGDSEGVPVKVVVTDETDGAISTAIIRHPQEADRHRVNAVDGSWEASVLYLPDGSELVFTPGIQLQLEISAPGYITQVVQYNVRKRNNRISVQLAKLELDNEDVEEPVLQFGREHPRDASTGAPAN